MSASIPAEATNEIESAIVTAERPPAATTTPPIAGPISRDRCCPTPSVALAVSSSSSPPASSVGISATWAGRKSCEMLLSASRTT